MQLATDVKLTTLATVRTRVPPLAGCEQWILAVQVVLDVSGARAAAGQPLDGKDDASVRLTELQLVGTDRSGSCRYCARRDRCRAATPSRSAREYRPIFPPPTSSSTCSITLLVSLDVEVAVPGVCEDVDAADLDATDRVPVQGELRGLFAANVNDDALTQPVAGLRDAAGADGVALNQRRQERLRSSTTTRCRSRSRQRPR